MINSKITYANTLKLMVVSFAISMCPEEHGDHDQAAALQAVMVQEPRIAFNEKIQDLIKSVLDGAGKHTVEGFVNTALKTYRQYSQKELETAVYLVLLESDIANITAQRPLVQQDLEPFIEKYPALERGIIEEAFYKKMISPIVEKDVDSMIKQIKELAQKNPSISPEELYTAIDLRGSDIVRKHAGSLPSLTEKSIRELISEKASKIISDKEPSKTIPDRVVVQNMTAPGASPSSGGNASNTAKRCSESDLQQQEGESKLQHTQRLIQSLKKELRGIYSAAPRKPTEEEREDTDRKIRVLKEKYNDLDPLLLRKIVRDMRLELDPHLNGSMYRQKSSRHRINR